MRSLKSFHAIRREVGRAIGAFDLIQAGDRILVALSGGKDSWTLLHVLHALRARAPIHYEIVAVHIDAGFPDFDRQGLASALAVTAVPFHLERTEIAGVIAAKLRPGSSYCALCARLRRGNLYAVADRLGCNKIALGHHLDDAIETLLLNQFFVGRLAAMSPKMLADNGRHTIVRPLIRVEERQIVLFAGEAELPIFPCACPSSGKFDVNRQRMKRLVADLAVDIPHVRRSLLKAMGNLQPRHLLAGPSCAARDEKENSCWCTMNPSVD